MKVFIFNIIEILQLQYNGKCNELKKKFVELLLSQFVSTLKAGDSPRMILQKTQSSWRFPLLESRGCCLLLKPGSQPELGTGTSRVGAGVGPGQIWEQRMESLRASIFKQEQSFRQQVWLLPCFPIPLKRRGKLGRQRNKTPELVFYLFYLNKYFSKIK